MRFDKRILVLRKYIGYYDVDPETKFYIPKENAPEELIDAIDGLNAAIKKERREDMHIY